MRKGAPMKRMLVLTVHVFLLFSYDKPYGGRRWRQGAIFRH